jgi:hypothetical protein
MTFVPSQSIKEFVITYPVFCILLAVASVIALSIIVRFWFEYQTMSVNITQICIGAACPK